MWSSPQYRKITDRWNYVPPLNVGNKNQESLMLKLLYKSIFESMNEYKLCASYSAEQETDMTVKERSRTPFTYLKIFHSFKLLNYVWENIIFEFLCCLVLIIFHWKRFITHFWMIARALMIFFLNRFRSVHLESLLYYYKNLR